MSDQLQEINAKLTELGNLVHFELREGHPELDGRTTIRQELEDVWGTVKGMDESIDFLSNEVSGLRRQIADLSRRLG